MRNKFKKTIMATLVLGMISSSTLVYGTEKPEATTELTIDIEATLLNIDLPLGGGGGVGGSISGAINPNEEYSKAFVTPNIALTNSTTAPIIVRAKITPSTSKDNIDLVNEDTFGPSKSKEWKDLNGVESGANIALGMGKKSEPEITQWFVPISGEDVTGNVNFEIAAASKVGTEIVPVISDVNLRARHGMAFKEGRSISYDIVFTAELR